MSKRVARLMTAFSLLLLAPSLALAQQQEAPTYTFVSLWTIPRAQWSEYVGFGKKTTGPIYERLFADGTITSWGTFATVVHEENGSTHGFWFEATSIANIEKTLKELQALPPSVAMTGPTVKHHDYLMRSHLRRGKASSGSNGYLGVNYTQIQPGKYQDWRALFDKHIKPTLDEQLANGTLLMYQIEGEQIHTENSSGVFIAYMTPNAEAADKYFAAINALLQKNPQLGEAVGAVTVPAAHRDYFARVTGYAQK